MRVLLNKSFILLFFIISSLAGFAQNGSFNYLKVPNNLISNVGLSNSIVSKNNILNLEPLESHLPKGYSRKGDVDYTVVVQNVLNNYRNVIFPNFPILINQRGLSVSSNSILYFDKGSRLIMKANSMNKYQLLRIHDVSNVKVLNAVLDGDRMAHIGAGEWGHGISISGSNNITVDNFKIQNFWGDGIYVGRGKGKSSGIQIANGIIDKCRRNGISITNGINVSVSKVLISNTSGTSPMFGIDIEPNSNVDVLDNIEINDYISFNNRNGALMLGLNKLGVGQAKKTTNIKVNNLQDFGSFHGVYVGNLTNGAKQINGLAQFSNISLSENQKPLLIKSNSGNGFKVQFKALEVNKPKNVNFTKREILRVMKNRKDVNIVQ